MKACPHLEAEGVAWRHQRGKRMSPPVLRGLKGPEPPILSSPKGHVDLGEAYPRGRAGAWNWMGVWEVDAGGCACPGRRGLSHPSPDGLVLLCSGRRLAHFLHFCEGKSLSCLPSSSPPQRGSSSARLFSQMPQLSVCTHSKHSQHPLLQPVAKARSWRARLGWGGGTDALPSSSRDGAWPVFLQPPAFLLCSLAPPGTPEGQGTRCKVLDQQAAVL